MKADILKKIKVLRLAVVGSRELEGFLPINIVLEEIKETLQSFEVVSGGARGVDNIAVTYADTAGLPKKIFPADWDKHGKSAGFIRNSEIVENSDMTLAFWDGQSKGTLDTVSKSQKAKHPTILMLCQPKTDYIAKLIYSNVPGHQDGIASADFSPKLKELILAVKEIA
jgi:hypothetical protein